MSDDTPWPVLTPREREVCDRIAQFRSYTEIATELGITARTVEAHVTNIMAKLPPAPGLTPQRRILRWELQGR